MQKVISSLIILILFAASVPALPGLPLVFKGTKEIKSSDETRFSELATVNAAAFKEMRIGVVLVDGEKRSGSSAITIHAVEGEDLIHINGFTVSAELPSGSVDLERFPGKIRIMAKESGTYKIFIWAS